MDALYELDKWIEERVYNRFEPTIDDGDETEPCPDCNGTGQVLPAAVDMSDNCPCFTCEGSGVIFLQPPSLGWERNEDGRYSYWDYQYEDRSYYVSEFWPRRFSTNTLLSVDLAKKFRISIKPVVNLSDVVIGYEVESSLRPCVIVVQETLEEAICLLVVMITKNTEVKDV